VLGHAGAGKTTLVEALLAASGTIRSPGSVEKGSTVCDFTEQERRLCHSLDVSICHLDHHGSHVNLLDTPGYPELFGRALAVLTAVETGAVVVNAEQGLESVAQRALVTAEERRVCRLVVINKIDSESADPAAALEAVRRVFGPRCLPLNLPARGGRAVADCFFGPTEEVPDFSSVAAAHAEITDRIVELDDTLMERYLEHGAEPALEELHEPFERALREGHLIPVCFVSARTGAGMRQLLRILTELLPNPLEGNPVEFRAHGDPCFVAANGNGNGGTTQLPLDGKGGKGRNGGATAGGNGGEHFIGHVFKLNVDPYLGRLATLRVHQGEVRSGETIFVGDKRKAVRLAHLYSIQGKELHEIPSAVAGDFCTVAKIDDLNFGDVLHSSHDEDDLALCAVDIPQPTYGVAIEVQQRGQERKLADVLQRLAAEDPSVRIEHNSHAHETVLWGLGHLHVKLLLERMHTELGLDIVTHPPRIPYRETVSRTAEARYRHKKQTGGAGQFGEVALRVEPLARGAGFQFASAVVGGAIPSQYIPAVEKGVRQALTEGAVAGYPIVDVRVTALDGKHHSVDSKEVAFIAAGKRAFQKAVAEAAPQVLEPIAKLEIAVPNRCVGDITGHLAALRGRISGTALLDDARTCVHAEAPLAELTQFETSLKSMTAGEGTFTMAMDHYAPAPPAVQRSLEEALASRRAG
jgi:elongation factor G